MPNLEANGLQYEEDMTTSGSTSVCHNRKLMLQLAQIYQDWTDEDCKNIACANKS